jgi:type II secretory pathway component PulM
MLVSLAGGAFVIFVSAIIYGTMASSISRHDLSIQEKQLQLQQIAVYAQTYADAERSRRELESRLNGPPLKLLTRLQESAEKHGLTIAGMSEKGENAEGQVKESLVEVQIRDATIDKLTTFLNELERDQRIIKVRKLNMRASADQKLNVFLTVGTYQLAKT